MGNLWFASSKSSYSSELKKESLIFVFKRLSVGSYYSDALSITWFH